MNILLAKQRPLQLASVGGLRALGLATSALPASQVPMLGRRIGRVIHSLDRGDEVARRYLMSVAGMDATAARAAALRTWEGMGIMLLEYLQMSRLLASGEFERRTRTRGLERIRAALSAGRGAIVVAGHQMSWEWMLLALAHAGLPIHTVVLPSRNPWLDRYRATVRGLTGQRLIASHAPVEQMTAVLQRNEILVLMADQAPGRSHFAVPFLGRSAATVRGPGLLAVRRRCPVIPVECWRDPDDVYHVAAHEPIDPAAFGTGRAAAQAITAAYTRRLEEFVLRHPDQWRWWFLRSRWIDELR